MDVYDLCLASDWDPDGDFFELVEEQARSRGMTTFLVWPRNLEETAARLRRNDLHFRFLVDRATNTTPEFIRLHESLACRSGALRTVVLDPPQCMLRVADKAIMHREFIRGGDDRGEAVESARKALHDQTGNHDGRRDRRGQ